MQFFIGLIFELNVQILLKKMCIIKKRQKFVFQFVLFGNLVRNIRKNGRVICFVSVFGDNV